MKNFKKILYALYPIPHTCAPSVGQSLVEVLAAVGMVGLVLLGIVAGVTIAIRSATFAKNQSLATKFSQ